MARPDTPPLDLWIDVSAPFGGGLPVQSDGVWHQVVWCLTPPTLGGQVREMSIRAEPPQFGWASGYQCEAAEAYVGADVLIDDLAVTLTRACSPQLDD